MGSLDDLAKAVNGDSDWPEIVDDTPQETVPTQSQHDAERYRVFAELKWGQLPVIASGLALYAGEHAHFEVSGIGLNQRRIVSREYVQQSNSLTFFFDGMAFGSGKTSGHIEERQATVYLGSGTLTLTSLRLVYGSANAGFSIPWQQVFSVTPTRGAVSVVNGSIPGAPIVFGYQDPELLAACMLACRARSRG